MLEQGFFTLILLINIPVDMVYQYNYTPLSKIVQVNLHLPLQKTIKE